MNVTIREVPGGRSWTVAGEEFASAAEALRWAEGRAGEYREPTVLTWTPTTEAGRAKVLELRGRPS